MPAAPEHRPPVVVDLDLDDIPDTTFSQYKFRHKIGDDPIVFTLEMDNDHLLANFTEWSRRGDIYDLYARMFEHTAKKVQYEDGTDVDVVKYLEGEGEDINQLRRGKLEDYREWFPDKVEDAADDWLPGLGPADLLSHWLYSKTVSLRKLSHMAQSAMSQWGDELTDTSMRPQRLSRRDRRSASRRR